MKMTFAKMLKRVAKYFALAACGSASIWGGYQPEEPKNLNNLF